MSDMNITIKGAKRLLTAGKYCDKNIVVTAEGVVPSGTLEITENGTHDVSGYASAEVNVADSPLPIEIETDAEMTALLETAEVGSIYKYVGESGTYENGALYICVNLIAFTFQDGGRIYSRQAEEGMTWREFINSEYNAIGLNDSKFLIFEGNDGKEYVCFYDTPGGRCSVQIYDNVTLTDVLPTDTIINGLEYTFIA